MEASGYRTEAESDGQGGHVWDDAKRAWDQRPEITWQNPGFEQTDDHPVVQVSWNDCVAFCQWLSEEEGKTYGLPTQAQWEYACRSGSTTMWCFGDDEGDLEQFAWCGRQGGNSPHPVAQKASNGFGLFDMHGNVREWCLDWYDKDHYSSSPPDDPTGPGIGVQRVARGGDWYRGPRDCRSANLLPHLPDDRNAYLGFRLTQVVEAPNQNL